MRSLKISLISMSLVLVLGLTARLTESSISSMSSRADQQPVVASPEDAGPLAKLSRATARYRLDASQSKFIAHALPGGLLWFMGHEHLVAVREFTGEAQLTLDSITPASLEITAKTQSMIETSSVFTEQQKQIIDKELREIVL